MKLTNAQINVLQNDLKVAERNYNTFKKAHSPAAARSYWLGRLDALYSINNLIGFSEKTHT